MIDAATLTKPDAKSTGMNPKTRPYASNRAGHRFFSRKNWFVFAPSLVNLRVNLRWQKRRRAAAVQDAK
jgi:hypothetical protein